MRSQRHNCGVPTVFAPTVCVDVLAFLGCGVFNCLEETWEEGEGIERRGRRGGRAQYVAGLSERNSFALASPPALID